MANIVGFYNVALAKTLKTFVLLGKLNYWNLGPFLSTRQSHNYLSFSRRLDCYDFNL